MKNRDKAKYEETLRVNTSVSSSNIHLVEFENQDTNPALPRHARKLDINLELAIDDNFLYVWIKNRWKRIPLSSF